jgi:hypothetical protein
LQKTYREEDKQMHDIILITGSVHFAITLDPTIWIFDDRRFELAERISGAVGLAIPFTPFLNNAEPFLDATKVICHRREAASVELTLEQAKSAYLCFARDGKPIKEGGPALLFLEDGSNKMEPVDYIQRLEVK